MSILCQVTSIPAHRRPRKLFPGHPNRVSTPTDRCKSLLYVITESFSVMFLTFFCVPPQSGAKRQKSVQRRVISLSLLLFLLPLDVCNYVNFTLPWVLPVDRTESRCTHTDTQIIIINFLIHFLRLDALPSTECTRVNTPTCKYKRVPVKNLLSS